ncbi:DUF6286 domain-containing protein [Spongiactinospora sp. TRM90649]|uniref:DUF6286 domain-containing protein n=1 Tax=Spongiactinospora sp. TRM90649 TaxID=3031114 RepID=UPI0023F77815|nr:DUF6286 domain-containing protein [Spongiactinospora sp. TRM90649]MDF5752629.1 DUF6286 domain-containing protein [Spongiactinospora sp. TRM90649]
MTSSLQHILDRSGTSGEDGHEASRRAAARALRPTRAPAGIVAAALLTAVLLLLAAEAIGAVLGTPLRVVPFERLVAVASARAWSDPLVQVVAAALVVLAGALLVSAALPGRTRLVPVQTRDPLIVIGFTRAGLRRTLRAAAETVDGVGRVRVRLVDGRIEIVVTAGDEPPGALLRDVGAAVGDRLAGLGALGAGEVVVRLRRTGG